MALFYRRIPTLKKAGAAIVYVLQILLQISGFLNQRNRIIWNLKIPVSGYYILLCCFANGFKSILILSHGL
jgi:hypothetical protein